MDESRIKVGTRIKILETPKDCYETVGMIGTICADSVFHNKGEIKDRGGFYWMTNYKPRPVDYKRICLCPSTKFKILKY